MTAAALSSASWPIRGPVRLGLVALLLVVGGFGGWSVGARLTGAIIAPGQIALEENQHAIEHPDGGVVAEILVRDGQAVAAGAVLLRLDGADLASDRAVIRRRLHVLLARMARLGAERDGAEAVDFAPNLLAAAATMPDLARTLDGQQRLFAARAEAHAQAIAQLSQQALRLESQIRGVDAQIAAVTRRLSLAREELAAQAELAERGLTPTARVLALRREEAEFLGQLGELQASRAEIETRQIEVEMSILQVRTERREGALAELRSLEADMAELAERDRQLTRRLARMELRAPVAGIVHGLAARGAQSVLRPADPAMFIIPQDQSWLVTTRVGALDIDQVHVGQEALVRISAFDPRRTPDVVGHVTHVSADIYRDDATGEGYYAVDLILDPGEIARLSTQRLLPGLPVEVFLRTRDQRPITYLTEPLMAYFARALRQ